VTRAILWLTIPMTVLLPAWLWIGRLVFGVGGWFMLILIPVALILAVMLIVTTALAFTQDSEAGRPKSLTGFQTVAHLALWLALFVTGAVMPDFGDTDDSKRSALTQVFGYSDSLYDTSFALALAGSAASLVAWVVLLVSLTAARRRVAL
jgi:hypothetical protein